MKLYEPQPAILMYAYAGGWEVMRYVGKNVFSRTRSAATYWFDLANEWESKYKYEDNTLLKYWKFSAYGGFQIAGAFQFIFAFIIVAIFYFFQIIILFFWSIITSIFIAILQVYNFLYSNAYKIFFRCPNCYEQMKIPIYVCPGCATDHSRLWPSVYGVFSHRCNVCGTKMPTLDTLGRKNLIQKCVNPKCNYPMNKEIGRLINIHIPVVGGPLTGKSNYIFMAINQFIENFAKPRGYFTEFPDENHDLQYNANLALLSSGDTMRPTPDTTPQAYNLAVSKPRQRIGRILYVYDAAGEAYATENYTLLQSYYKYIHGVIFIIDPFSIRKYYKKHEGEIEKIKSAIRPSTLDVMSTYERMLKMLETSVGITRGKKFSHPLAVLVTKSDALDLENEIGLKAAQKLMRTDPSIVLVNDAINTLVIKFLQEHGLGNLNRNIETQFENAAYFSCSSLGRLPDESNKDPFKPIRVLAPLLWILGQTNVVDLNEIRIKKIDEIHRSRAQTIPNFFKSAKYYYWDSLPPNSNNYGGK